MLYPELKVLATLLILKVVDKIRMTQQPCKHYTLNGEVLKRKGKMVVGKDAGLKTKILQHFHISAIGVI